MAESRELSRGQVRHLLDEAAEEISQSGSPTAQLDARVLFCHILGIDETVFYSRDSFSISDTQMQQYRSLVKRRARGEPVAYLTGHKEFMALDFLVNEHVLIPRPETEILIEEVLAFISQSPRCSRECLIADVGTGSGAIAVSLASYHQQSFVYATDLSSSALSLAETNATRHRVIDRVRFLQGDLLECLPEPVDVIAANLPYTILEELPPGVIDYEPHLALDGGHAGLDIYRRFLRQAPAYTKRHGGLFLEIDPRQAVEVTALAEDAFPRAAIRTVQDLAGRDRLVIVALKD